jgi:predicted exporter
MSRGNALLRWSVVLAVLLVGAFFSLNVSINDNALDLLPDGAVKGDLQILQRLGLVDRLFITLSVDEKEYPTEASAQNALKKSVEKLGNLLLANEFFSFVLARLPRGYESQLFNTLLTYLPVLFDEKDYTEIEYLTSVPGLEEVMQENFILLNSPAGIGMKKQVQRDPLGLTRLLLKKLVHLQAEFSMRLDDGFFMNNDGRSCLVLAESILSLTDSKGAQIIQKELEDAFSKALMVGVEARIIGSLPHTLANSRSIQRDLRLLLPVAAILLLLLLGITLRDIRAFIVFSVPFMAALPAIAVTAVFFGNISMLALGFGIVLLGIAVDFSIHLYLTLSRDKGTQKELLRRVRKPFIFATLTTTSVLTILLFSEVASHRQMATLALAGVLLAVFFAWLVIPTIVPEKEQKKNGTGPQNCSVTHNISGIHHLSPLLQNTALTVWGVLLAAGLLAWPQLQYNGDLRVLDVPDRAVLADEHHFSITWGQKGDQAFVIGVGKSLEEALDTNSLIYRFLRENNFDTYQSLAPILPGSGVQENNRKLWHQFWATRRPAFDKEFTAIAQAKGFSDQAFIPFFRQIEDDPGLLLPGELYNSPLQVMLATMMRSSPAKEGDSEKQFMVMSTVAIDDDTLPLLLAFAEQDPKISVLANRKWRAEVEQLLRKDIVLLCLAAGCAVFFLVALQFRKIDVTAAVLAPVLSSLAAMSVFCWITGVELNMMHLMMGIMVIGLCVDYGIFIVCSRLTRDTGTVSLAVSICAGSSLIGFGVLAFAHHPALHSLGITVLVGIGAAWPVALFVSPSLIRKQNRAVQ